MKQDILPRLNICMLLPSAYEPNTPASPEIREIYGQWFPKMGHRVVWITPGNGCLKGIKEVTFQKVKVHIVHRYLGSSLVRKILTTPLFLWREMKIANNVIQREKCNIIQVREDVFAGLLAVYLKRRYKIPFVFQYTFPFAEASLEGHRLNQSRLAYMVSKLQQLVLPYVLRKADLILPISKWMEADLANKGIPRRKMIPLPLAANTSLFSPNLDSAERRLEYNSGDCRIIVYLGTLHKLRNLEVIINALAHLRRNGQKVKLLMVGEGNGRRSLEEQAHNIGVENEVIFTGQVPYYEVPQFIACADVALSPVPPLDIFKVSSPCKLFEYMAMAKPVVANEEIPEHKEVLEQSGGGVLVPFTSEAIAQAIIELLNNPRKAAEMGQRGREWVVANRTYEILARQVEEKYFELLEL